MYHHLRRTFGVPLCLVGLASPLVCAAEPPSKPLPAAQLVAVEGAKWRELGRYTFHHNA